MHPHTRSTSTSSPRSVRRRVTIGLVAALATVSACGGDDTATTPDTAASSADTADTAASSASTVGTPATTAATDPAPAAPAAPAAPTGAGVPDDLCATIPSLDVINAVLSEPVTAAENLPRTPGEAICDLTGDGASNVTFNVVTDTTREGVDEIVAELGYTVTDIADPALPGAYGYAGVAAVIVDGTQYSVQAIDMDVIMDAANPQWITRSAELLKQWLPLLGVTP